MAHENDIHIYDNITSFDYIYLCDNKGGSKLFKCSSRCCKVVVCLLYIIFYKNTKLLCNIDRAGNILNYDPLYLASRRSV